jgi:2-C-methyl-D-erythritol 2,4-cyclodiphosphate synthase
VPNRETRHRGQRAEHLNQKTGNLKLDTGNWYLALRLIPSVRTLQSSHLTPPLSNRGRRGQPRYRVGLGFDAHELRRGRRLVLGGLHIPSGVGLLGHSDADVLLHALTDALLGALALPDIGTLYPDTDRKWKDAESRLMLEAAHAAVKTRGYRLANADCILVCDRPRLAPHAEAVRASIARLLVISPDCIGLQAKTTEGTLLALKGKSIAAMAVVLVARSNGPKYGFRSSHFGVRRSKLR